MGDKFVGFLITAMERLRSALCNVWKRYTTPPPTAEPRDTWTDQG